ncbi:Nn.00g075490.m01.CDS01 [Neocucurbitaria sp. VM-36]
MPLFAPENVLYVDPVVFKRHVASHLEQLALFAIPINLTSGDDINSNAAVELGVDLPRSKSNSLDVRRPVPPCSRSVPAIHVDWYSLEGYPNFNLCPSCYDSVFAGTPFAPKFSQLPNQDSVERFCDFRSPWPRLAWLLTIRQQRQSLEFNYSLAEIEENERLCPSDRKLGFDRVDWYALFGEENLATFSLCPCDVRRIEVLFPSLRGFFLKLNPSSEKHTCDLRISSHRFPKYLDLLVEIDAEAKTLSSKPDFNGFLQLILENASKDVCPRDKASFLREWYFVRRLPEFTVCERCYDELVRPAIQSGTWIPGLFNKYPEPVPSEDTVHGTICCLYSSHMRRIWEMSVKDDDFAYLKHEAHKRHVDRTESVAEEPFIHNF